MVRQRWWWVVGSLALVLAASTVRGHKAPDAQDAVSAQVNQFIEGVESRRIQDALKTVAPSFTWDGYSRGDVSRGLFTLNREWREVRVFVDRLEVTVDPSGDRAVARLLVQVNLLGDQGRTLDLGTDRPAEALVTYQRFGRRWLATEVHSDGSLNHLGYGQ